MRWEDIVDFEWLDLINLCLVELIRVKSELDVKWFEHQKLPIVVSSLFKYNQFIMHRINFTSEEPIT